MAQIRQLASLLSQQQQQVFPPFLSQLQSPAHRALPPPSPSQSGAASGTAAVVGRRGGDAKDEPGQCSASARAVASVCRDDTPQLGGAVGAAALEASAGAQQPATPGHRSHAVTPRSQSPSLVTDDDEDAEERQQNVSGSSDGSGGES